jgi:mono/diheme cytochrome c family protein
MSQISPHYSSWRGAGSWVLSAILVLIVSSVFFLAGCQSEKKTETQATKALTSEELVKRGEYMVTVGGCNDCHTPLKTGPNGPEPDMSRMLSGHPEILVMPPPPKLPQGPWGWIGAATTTAFAGPWGISYTANLTPDSSTGLGLWKEEMFVNAMKTGKHMGIGRPIMPPIPWQGIGRMKDEDLKAVFAYLRTIPAIKNHVPAVVLPVVASK